MKKLLTLLFAGMVAFSLAMPVFANPGAQETTKKEKKTKAPKTKKEKKTKEKATQ